MQGTKWPISYCVLLLVWSAAHGEMLAGAAVLYSDWKLNGVPEQSAIAVHERARGGPSGERLGVGRNESRPGVGARRALASRPSSG